jgi:hypothetical protein
MDAWTVKDNTGQLRSDFVCASRLEVGRRIVPGHFDAFRLRVSTSYRELFDRAVGQVLEREGWQIVRAKPRRTRSAQDRFDRPAAL